MRRQMTRERHLANLNAAIDRGIADADAGRVMDSDQVRQALLERARKNPMPKT
jgi:predicted transcriptional regulator